MHSSKTGSRVKLSFHLGHPGIHPRTLHYEVIILSYVGYEQFGLMRSDPALCFRALCGEEPSGTKKKKKKLAKKALQAAKRVLATAKAVGKDYVPEGDSDMSDMSDSGEEGDENEALSPATVPSLKR
jgi:hypothetical protein